MAIDALVINPELDGRMRLKQMGASLSLFKTLHLSSSLKEGLERLNTKVNCDVVYVSSKFEEVVLTEFIRTCKQTISGADSAYLMLFNENRQRAEDVANRAISGIDGFLFEPFSTEELVRSTALAQAIRRDRVGLRERAGLEILINAALVEIDKIALQAKAGSLAKNGLTGLERITKMLPSLSSELQNYYFEKAVERFENAQPVRARAPYVGASNRVKQRVIKRTLH